MVASGDGADGAIGVGDHVVLSFDSCGDCRNCRGAAPAYCDSFASLNLFGGREEGASRFTDAVGGALGSRWFGQSSFAEYALVPARNAVRVDPDLPLELLGPLGCGALTGAGAVLNTFRAAPATPSSYSARERWAWPRSWLPQPPAYGPWPSTGIAGAWTWPSGSARSRCPP